MKQLAKILLSISLISSLMWGYNDSVFQVQSILDELGYKPGTPDGVMGKRTRKAIKKFQSEMGLNVTGQIDAELESSMGLGDAPAVVTQTTQTVQTPVSSKEDEGFFKNPFEGASLGPIFKEGTYRVGLVTAWPSFGLGFKADYSDKIAIELVANPGGSFSTYFAKVDYYITKEDKFNTYVYGSAGIGRYDYTWLTDSGTENVGIFSAGGGVEWSWRRYLGNDIPDLYSTAEVGYASIPFEYWDFGGLLFGTSLYYKF